MTAQPTTAPETSKAEAKALKKAAEKRHNQLLANLDNSLTLLTSAVWEAQERVSEARRALKNFAADAPTQAVGEYLDEMAQLLANSAAPIKTADVDVIVEHYFPGRRARMSAECEQRNRDRRTEQMERYAGYSGY